jgi:hypothetical protein
MAPVTSKPISGRLSTLVTAGVFERVKLNNHDSPGPDHVVEVTPPPNVPELVTVKVPAKTRDGNKYNTLTAMVARMNVRISDVLRIAQLGM